MTESDPGARSRDNATLAGGYGVVKAGTVLELAPANDAIVADRNKLRPFTALRNTGGDVILAVKGILGITQDTGTVAAGTSADRYVAFLARDAEVNFNNLFYPAESTAGGEKLGTVVGLKALNIIPRGEHTGTVLDTTTEL